MSDSTARPSARVLAFGGVLALLLVLVLGVALKLAGGRGPDDSASAPSSTAGPTPTTTQPAKALAPAIVDTGEDFDAIVRSLIAFNDWIVANPDPSLLIKTIDSSCPCFASTQKNLSDLAVKGWHYDPGRWTEVLRVRAERVAANVVDVFVVRRSDEARILDARGQVVDREPEYPPSSYFYTLQRGTEGRWRITQIEFGSVL